MPENDEKRSSNFARKTEQAPVETPGSFLSLLGLTSPCGEPIVMNTRLLNMNYDELRPGDIVTVDTIHRRWTRSTGGDDAASCMKPWPAGWPKVCIMCERTS